MSITVVNVEYRKIDVFTSDYYLKTHEKQDAHVEETHNHHVCPTTVIP